MTQASIITIGDELLIGQVIDTNSAWMGQELNKAGIRVVRRVAVGDVWDEIWQALDEESKHANIILITGGLGPTADDITKPLLCKYFGGTLIVDEAAKQNVVDIFTRFNRPIIQRNLMQAGVPNVCTVSQTKRGRAPGMWLSKKHSIAVSIRGVRPEVKGRRQDYGIPQVRGPDELPSLLHRA